jgi:hypothetical protein
MLTASIRREGCGHCSWNSPAGDLATPRRTDKAVFFNDFNQVGSKRIGGGGWICVPDFSAAKPLILHRYLEACNHDCIVIV